MVPAGSCDFLAAQRMPCDALCQRHFESRVAPPHVWDCCADALSLLLEGRALMRDPHAKLRVINQVFQRVSRLLEEESANELDPY